MKIDYGDELLIGTMEFYDFAWCIKSKYKNGKKKILDTGYISKWDYYKTVGVQLIVALVPKKIRLFIFTKLLR